MSYLGTRRRATCVEVKEAMKATAKRLGFVRPRPEIRCTKENFRCTIEQNGWFSFNFSSLVGMER
jgi:hypothetical protein